MVIDEKLIVKDKKADLNISTTYTSGTKINKPFVVCRSCRICKVLHMFARSCTLHRTYVIDLAETSVPSPPSPSPGKLTTASFLLLSTHFVIAVSAHLGSVAVSQQLVGTRRRSCSATALSPLYVDQGDGTAPSYTRNS